MAHQAPPLIESISTIFNFRLQSAQKNLNDLSNLIESIKNRNTHLLHLHLALVRDRSEIEKVLGGLRTQIDRAIQDLNSDFGIDSRSIKADVENADHQLKLLEAQLKSAKIHATEISVLQLDSDVLTHRNKEFSRKIKDGRTSLQRIGDRDESTSGVAESWKALKDQASVWVEYLDYLAGLSLRHEGLPSGVCDIADALIKELWEEPKEFAALTIPGREGCAGILPKVVYLRFPEWTVWALPLAVHEFWHIIESSLESDQSQFLELFTNRLLRTFELKAIRTGKEVTFSMLKQMKGGNIPLLSEYLADAFAVFTMGPAYAYACVILLLDPLAEGDRQRAEVIFRALERLHNIDKYAGLDRVRKNLDALWRQAIREAGDPKSLDPPVPTGELDRWIEQLMEYMRFIPGLLFPSQQQHLNLVEALLNESEVDPKGLSIRLVLAAAWQARVEKPQHFDELSTRCYSLCLQILKNSGNKGLVSNSSFINMAR
jgi:hypothetical protein